MVRPLTQRWKSWKRTAQQYNALGNLTPILVSRALKSIFGSVSPDATRNADDARQV
jgi:hypothetical protein